MQEAQRVRGAAHQPAHAVGLGEEPVDVRVFDRGLGDAAPAQPLHPAGKQVVKGAVPRRRSRPLGRHPAHQRTERPCRAGQRRVVEQCGNATLLAHPVTEPAQVTVVQKLRELFGTYQTNRDLINIGAYERGSDAQIDRAIAAFAPIRDLVRQSEGERVDMARSLADLVATARMAGIGGEESQEAGALQES